ncbi:MAG: hydroxymethylpyrimidine/phosphomethylpyrimidine kinase [Acidobacteriota bacterium]|nr:hydroxymethylpyrimidine/phosphomethylpyrimidine kinase [Acidobacteriota bacterium]
MKTKSKIQNPKPKICLTIAGFDPSGGAGIIADIKTFTAFGCFATAAVTSLTFQNTCGVFGAEHQSAKTLRGQIEPLVEDFEISAVKTGMLPSREIIEETAQIIKENKLKNLVVDPVIRSTSGFDLIDDGALRALIETLFPLADIVTPNLPEAEKIAQIKIENEADIERAARIMQAFGAKNVLIKGGHFLNAECGMRNAELNGVQSSKFKVQSSKTEDQKQKTEIQSGNSQLMIARDYLFVGEDLHLFEAEFIETNATHGTGCTLASAIAANLALGKNLIEAVGIAKKFVTEAIRAAPNLGNGNSPINHSILDFRF